MLSTDLPTLQTKELGWPWFDEITEEVHPEKDRWPRISIVTPSFNQGKYIEETVRSILLQNYPNLQYIVIDGGSTDNTVDILKKYSQWVDYWVSEPDRGQSNAINKGLSFCDGKWFNWVNSDDYLKPNALVEMVKAAENSGARIVSGVTENVRDNIPFGEYSTSLPADLNLPFFSLGINQPGSLLRLEDVKSCGGVREDLALCMDLDLWLKILHRNEHCHFELITKTVAAYRYHAESKTCSDDDTFALEEFSVLSDLYEMLSARSLTPSLRSLRNQCQAAKSEYESMHHFDSDAVERAYLDRLLATDSLLFRAIMRADGVLGQPFSFLKTVLQEIQPKLNYLYGEEVAKVKSTVWLRAMQNQGCLDIAGVLSLLKTEPRIQTVREIARIAVKGNRAS